ncbi:MAG TPA: hypothetical protein VKG86_08810 [Terracidiphilus sp.]|nr:hypothetical protein [Terracidiphilus sp.]
MGRVSFSDGLAIAGLILAIVLLVLDKAGKLKGPLLLALLGVAACMAIPLLFSVPWVSSAQPGMILFARRALMIFLLGSAWAALSVWITSGDGSISADRTESGQPAAAVQTPSLVLVFGVPLGDNDSASWLMMLKHYGPNPAYNCKIDFYDDDRKNIEHQWLVAHPNSPYPPPGLAAGESQKSVYIAETGPEGSAGGFPWNPLDPDRQHYTIQISCRDGLFEEKLEVARVNGVLRSIITIERGLQWVKKNPTLDPFVFRCEDPEFIRAPLATAIPKSNPGKVVHPGWKPTHRFEMPVAIIDPNGNLQVGGITLPDGTLSHGPGCWNILTQHFGDNPPKPH